MSKADSESVYQAVSSWRKLVRPLLAGAMLFFLAWLCFCLFRHASAFLGGAGIALATAGIIVGIFALLVLPFLADAFFLKFKNSGKEKFFDPDSAQKN